MKFLLSLMASLLTAGPALSSQETSLSKPTYQCVCFQNVPFEGYIIYVIERNQGQESWIPLDAAPINYDNASACETAIKVNKTCDELSKM